MDHVTDMSITWTVKILNYFFLAVNNYSGEKLMVNTGNIYEVFDWEQFNLNSITLL